MFSFVFGYLFLVVAISCFGVSFYFYKKSKEYLSKVIKVEGVVKDFKESEKVYYPIYEFQPPTGNPVTLTSNTGSNPPSHQIGDSVTVLFNPASPHEAKLDTIFQTYLESLISGGAGVLSLLMGLIFTIVF